MKPKYRKIEHFQRIKTLMESQKPSDITMIEYPREDLYNLLNEKSDYSSFPSGHFHHTRGGCCTEFAYLVFKIKFLYRFGMAFLKLSLNIRNIQNNDSCPEMLFIWKNQISLWRDPYSSQSQGLDVQYLPNPPKFIGLKRSNLPTA